MFIPVKPSSAENAPPEKGTLENIYPILTLTKLK
jgi:hypothetical protein